MPQPASRLRPIDLLYVAAVLAVLSTTVATLVWFASGRFLDPEGLVYMPPRFALWMLLVMLVMNLGAAILVITFRAIRNRLP